MSRSGTWICCATLASAAALLGCGGGGGGGGSKSPMDIVPRSNDVTGWTVATGNTYTSNVVAATGTTEQQVTDLIDGGATIFFAPPSTPVEFAWQNYLNTSLPPAQGATGATMKLYLLQMPDATQAANLYAAVLSGSLYGGNDWTDPTSPAIGSKSRITDSGSDWWINFVKGNYYVECRMSPSYGPAPDFLPHDATTKQAALDFATAVAKRM